MASPFILVGTAGVALGTLFFAPLLLTQAYCCPLPQAFKETQPSDAANDSPDIPSAPTDEAVLEASVSDNAPGSRAPLAPAESPAAH